MWIIPNTHPLYSAFAQDMVESKSPSGEYSKMCESSLTWRSKASPWLTWLDRWKRVKWLQLLSGRTLKQCQQNRFEIKLISSLVDIPAHRSVVPATEKEKMIQDTSGHTSQESYHALGQSSVFLRTSKGISPLDCKRLSEIWEDWVTKQRGEYLARRKLALHTEENGSLSWRTPSTTEAERGAETRAQVMKQENPIITLTHQVSWPTPTQCGNHNRKGVTKTSGDGLSTAVKQNGPPVEGSNSTIGKQKEQWPTPRSMSGGPSKGIRHSDLNQDAGGHLNPEWVEQLMGLPTGSTSFDSWEMESCHQQLNSLLGF